MQISGEQYPKRELCGGRLPKLLGIQLAVIHSGLEGVLFGCLGGAGLHWRNSQLETLSRLLLALKLQSATSPKCRDPSSCRSSSLSLSRPYSGLCPATLSPVAPNQAPNPKSKTLQNLRTRPAISPEPRTPKPRTQNPSKARQRGKRYEYEILQQWPVSCDIPTGSWLRVVAPIAIAFSGNTCLGMVWA